MKLDSTDAKRAKMTTWSIYRDANGGFAVRGFDIVFGEPEPVPHPIVRKVASLTAARRLIPRGLSHFRPSPGDPTNLVESWL